MEVKTVTLITAKAAREISNNIIDNDIGIEIPKIMDKILKTANEGNIQIAYHTPSNWSAYQRLVLTGFIRQLGYEAECNSSGTLTIKW